MVVTPRPREAIPRTVRSGVPASPISQRQAPSAPASDQFGCCRRQPTAARLPPRNQGRWPPLLRLRLHGLASNRCAPRSAPSRPNSYLSAEPQHHRRRVRAMVRAALRRVPAVPLSGGLGEQPRHRRLGGPSSLSTIFRAQKLQRFSSIDGSGLSRGRRRGHDFLADSHVLLPRSGSPRIEAWRRWVWNCAAASRNAVSARLALRKCNQYRAPKCLDVEGSRRPTTSRAFRHDPQWRRFR